MIGLKREIVEIVSYQNEWTTIYKETKTAIEKALDNIHFEIEHIGSTSINNMVAKPIIDIAIGLENLTEKAIQTVITELEKIGFIFRNNEGENGGYLFIKFKLEDVVTHHIHVVELNDQQWKNYIQFRNTLRMNAQLVSEYKKLKRGLAKKYPNNRLKYTNGKNEFIKNVITEKKPSS